MLVFVELKSVVTDSEVLNLSNKIKKLMEVKTDTIRINIKAEYKPMFLPLPLTTTTIETCIVLNKENRQRTVSNSGHKHQHRLSGENGKSAFNN